MNYLLKRLLPLILILLLTFVVLRVVVVPFAMRRQERQESSLNILALIPADAEAWCLRRNFFRRLPSSLWPGGQDVLPERLRAYGLPMDELARELGLDRFWGGEWLGGRSSSGDWFLALSLERLPRENELRTLLSARPDTLLTLSFCHAGTRGNYLIAASRAELLDAPSWLDALPDWPELHSLLLAGDWLEFAALQDEASGALLGVKTLLRTIHAEGLSWGGGQGLAALETLSPAPWPEESVDCALLDELPVLRRSAPFASNGRAMRPVDCRLRDDEAVEQGLRLWSLDGEAACAWLAR